MWNLEQFLRSFGSLLLFNGKASMTQPHSSSRICYGPICYKLGGLSYY